MEGEDRFREARKVMVRNQIRHRGVQDRRVLEALLNIPRHLFVPPPLRDRAYDDGPLPIGLGQTISQPYIVAVMTEMLQLRGDENVLEIGTGSGYQAAVLGQLAAQVHTVERHAGLGRQAAEVLDQLGYDNVFVHIGDGTLGWPQAAPYQAIIVTAAAPHIPEPLIEQLDQQGSLVIPVGDRYNQDLERWRKEGDRIYREHFFPVAFVPLCGQYGWNEDDWDSKEPLP